MWAYGKLKLKPWELYDLDLCILGDMIVAYQRARNEEYDEQMQVVAWQTALLMNSTGNFKKKIKPSDLYTTLAEIEEGKAKEYKPEDKQALQEELLKTFAGSAVVVQ